MKSKILQFPRHRDVRLVSRIARHAAGLEPEAAEGYLAGQIDIQRRTMLKRGVDPAAVEPALRALESAIRSAMWGHILTPGGAA